VRLRCSVLTWRYLEQIFTAACVKHSRMGGVGIGQLANSNGFSLPSHFEHPSLTILLKVILVLIGFFPIGEF